MGEQVVDLKDWRTTGSSLAHWGKILSPHGAITTTFTAAKDFDIAACVMEDESMRIGKYLSPNPFGSRCAKARCTD